MGIADAALNACYLLELPAIPKPMLEVRALLETVQKLPTSVHAVS
jgi:hypothetical protein